jgi:hypothetical protein
MATAGYHDSHGNAALHCAEEETFRLFGANCNSWRVKRSATFGILGCAIPRAPAFSGFRLWTSELRLSLVLTLAGIGKSYGERVLFADASWSAAAICCFL